MAIFLIILLFNTNLLKIETLPSYLNFRRSSDYKCDTAHLISQDWHAVDDREPDICWSYDQCPRESPPNEISKKLINFESNLVSVEPPWGIYLSGKGVHTIYLIRHGQYHYRDTDEESKLTKVGQAQATRTGKFLRKLKIIFNRAFYSTMTRATETFNLMQAEMDKEQVVHSDSEKMIEEGYPYPSNGEKLSGYKKSQIIATSSRLELFFETYFETFTQDTNTLVVCHGNVIRYLLMRFNGFPPEFWTRFDIRHTSITKLKIFSNGNISVVSYSDANHLPLQLQTTS